MEDRKMYIAVVGNTPMAKKIVEIIKGSEDCNFAYQFITSDEQAPYNSYFRNVDYISYYENLFDSVIIADDEHKNLDHQHKLCKQFNFVTLMNTDCIPKQEKKYLDTNCKIYKTVGFLSKANLKMLYKDGGENIVLNLLRKNKKLSDNDIYGYYLSNNSKNIENIENFGINR